MGVKDQFEASRVKFIFKYPVHCLYSGAWECVPTLQISELSIFVDLEPQTFGPDQVVLAEVYPIACFISVFYSHHGMFLKP